MKLCTKSSCRVCSPCLAIWLIAIIVLAAMAFITPGCTESAAGDANNPDQLSGRLTITGSSTVAPLVGEVAKHFESLYPGVRIDVQAGGSSQGIADVRRGNADIGMVSRTLNTNENDLDAHTIAMDGITIIVHRDNPTPSLTDQQVIDIFTGRVRNWREVGGNDAAITVANKAAGRATLDLFLSHFKLTSPDIRADVVIGDNQHGIRTITGDRNAITYVSIGTAEFEARRGTAIKLIPMSGAEPIIASDRAGDLLLARPLNLVTHGERFALVQTFLEFATSRDVKDLVEAQYFVPVAE